MSVNCVSDVINRIQRMQDEVEDMSSTMKDMYDEYGRDCQWATLENNDYYYALWKAYVEMDALSSAMSEAIYNLQQVRYA